MKNKIIFKTLMLKGEAGSTIVSMEKTGHVGTADIYTITFNDGSTTEISLENMSAITSVEKTSSTDTEDIYTITCADGSTQTFSVSNHNADIAAMSDDIDTIDARVDNFITSVVPNTVETLWTGSIKDVGDSATLSKAVSNFDYIDLYLLGSADSKYIRVPATQTAVQIQQQNLSDDASSNFLRLWEIGVSISGSTVSITKSIAWAWDDPDNSNPTVTANAQNSSPITRIDGVKVASNTPAEVIDIRVGVDGTTYNSAGAAVRGQLSDIHSVTTVSTNSTYINKVPYWINSSGVIQGSNSSIILPVLAGSVYTLTTTFNDGTNYALLKDTNLTIGNAPNYATGYTGRVMVAKNDIAKFTASEDAKYIIIRADTDSMQNAITFKRFGDLLFLDDVSECIDNTTFALNKDDLQVIQGIGSTGNKFIANSAMYIAYIPCEKNAMYTVKKAQDNRFAIMWTDAFPAVDVVTYGYLSDDTATELTIKTGTTAKYLCIYYYAQGTSIKTEQELFASLEVDYTGFTAIDRFARQHLAEPDTNGIYVVSKSGKYKTITSAINVAPADAVILIMPGTYEEQIDTKNKNVNLIGVDKESCIILDKSGMYNTPPLEISGGSVQNLTIIETSEQSTPSDSGTLPTLAYCIHSDWDSMENNSLLISNCTLKCNKRAAIGVGARNGFTLTVENCDIWSGVQVDTGHDARGAFFIHTYQYATNTTGTELIMRNNRITCDDSVVLCLLDEGGVHVTCDLENNNLYSGISGVSNSIVKGANNQDVTFSSTLIKQARCFGNNVSVLNN